MEEKADATALFVRQHRADDVAALALTLRRRPEVDAALALRQIEGWQRLRLKVPAWAEVEGLLFPPRLSLEQCSGQEAADYKAALAARLCCEGGTMVDLTGGLGVDFAAMARGFGRAVYVERNAELCRLARHNLPLLGLPRAEVVEAEAEAYLPQAPQADLYYLDPARRDAAGRKVAALADCSPDVERLMPRLRQLARVVMLKLSPMLDWHLAARALAPVAEVHVVAAGGECKELLLVCADSADEPLVVAAEGERRFAFRPADEAAARPTYTAQLGSYLYEPGPAVLKAGAYGLLAERFGLRKLHRDTHLYTADRVVPDWPGRTFRLLRTDSFARPALREFVRAVPRAHLAVRHFPASVAELRRRLRLADGGDRYCFATTLADGSHVLLTGEKLPPAART